MINMNVNILNKLFLRWITIALWFFVPMSIFIAISQYVTSDIMPRLIKTLKEEIPYSVTYNNLTVHMLEPYTSIHIDQINLFTKDKHELLFFADHVEVRIALWESIKHRTWVLSSLILKNAQFDKKFIRQNASFSQMLKDPESLINHRHIVRSRMFLNRHFSKLLKLHIKRLSFDASYKRLNQLVVNDFNVMVQMNRKSWYFIVKGTVLSPLHVGNFSMISRLNKPISFNFKKIMGAVYFKINGFKLAYLDHINFLQPYLKKYFLKQSELKSEFWIYFHNSKIQKIYAKTNIERLNTPLCPQQWKGYIYAKRHLNRFKIAFFNLSKKDIQKTTVFPAITWSIDLNAQRLPFELYLDEIKVLHAGIYNNSRLSLKRLSKYQTLIQLFTQFQTNNISKAFQYVKKYYQKYSIEPTLKIFKNGIFNGQVFWSGVFLVNNRLIKKQFHARVETKNLRIQYNHGPILTIPKGLIDTNLKDYQFLFDSVMFSSIKFEDIQVNLSFRKKSQLTILGQIKHQPFILKVDQLNDYKKKHTINALIKGSLNPARIFSTLNSNLFQLHGNTLYSARLFIDLYKNEWSLYVNSNLLGVNFVLPSLYLKAKEDSLPSSLKINYKNNLLTYNMKIGKQVMMLLQFYRLKTGINFLKGEINIGEDESHLPESRGLFINVNIPSLNWTYGQSFLTQIFHLNQSKTNIFSQAPKFLKQLNVHITQFNLFSNPINQFHLMLDFLPGKIKTSLNSAEVIGQLNFLRKKEITQVIGKFKKIKLEKHFSLQSGKKFHSDPFSLKALSRVAFDLNIQDLQYGSLYFNQLRLIANPFNGHLNVNYFFGKNSLFSFEAVGNAFIGNDNSTLKLKGKIKATDVGNLLTQWNLTSRLQNGAGKGNFDLVVQHFLMPFQQYTGRINVQISNGTITQLAPRVQSKVKWGKFLNALDLSTLWKKIFSMPKATNGLPFNTLSGDILFMNHKLATSNLSIDSDIAKIGASGEIDLKKHKYDIYIQVNPYLTTSVPVVLGMVGTPILGGAAFIANKALEPWISQKMKRDYHLTGSY